MQATDQDGRDQMTVGTGVDASCIRPPLAMAAVADTHHDDDKFSTMIFIEVSLGNSVPRQGSKQAVRARLVMFEQRITETGNR